MKNFKKIQLNNLDFNDIKIGDNHFFECFVDQKMVNQFAKLFSSYSPLHTDNKYAKQTEFGGTIVHGMLLASFFSTVLGMLCPGKRCLCLTQDLNFRNPLKPGNPVTISGIVLKKFPATRTIEFRTTVKDKDGRIIVDGNALVKVRNS